MPVLVTSSYNPPFFFLKGRPSARFLTGGFAGPRTRDVTVSVGPRSASTWYNPCKPLPKRLHTDLRRQV